MNDWEANDTTRLDPKLTVSAGLVCGQVLPPLKATRAAVLATAADMVAGSDELARCWCSALLARLIDRRQEDGSSLFRVSRGKRKEPLL